MRSNVYASGRLTKNLLPIPTSLSNQIFPLFISTSSLQINKPSPVPFKLALEQLESTPENSLYVGNEFLADIVGAKSVGMSAVWVNLRGEELDSFLDRFGKENRPDLVIESINELTKFL